MSIRSVILCDTEIFMRNASPNPLPTELRGQVGSSMWYFETQSGSFHVNVILKFNVMMVFVAFGVMHVFRFLGSYYTHAGI